MKDENKHLNTSEFDCCFLHVRFLHILYSVGQDIREPQGSRKQQREERGIEDSEEVTGTCTH